MVVGATDAATRAGIRIALEEAGLVVCAEVTSVQELVDEVERHRPDLCLVDVDIKGGGIRGAAELGGRAHTVPIVLLGDAESEEQFLDAMRVGAVGFVPRSISPTSLPKMVRAVLKGEAAIPRSLVTPLINQYRERTGRRQLVVPHRPDVDLTSREWQVLEFMREGLTTRQIADRLLISEVTVRRHIGSMLKKLNVDSRADALKLLQHG